ncbi:leucine--tRNA ligase [Candidatus Gracilibacteria bacterium]|nr:leucine--tRNA ligase [Candidatus Gracilibacteria bacterium]
MPIYNAVETEKKWQTRWADTKIYKTDLEKSKKPKYYNLVMFPYPSGDKLHIGHWYNFAPADSWGRYMRMKGYNVFEPQGYDSFGLPAENYAIKKGVHPTISIKDNIEYMRKQLSEMGAMYDFSKEVITSDPEYYKWTQWVFLKLYKAGLAYRKTAPVNWCPSCQTVLANEQVQEGICERCKHEVTKKDLTQWFFNIRKYAERLLNYEGLDWPEKTKLMQQHWIGKSIGSEILFDIVDETGSNKANGAKRQIKVFTTRIDTLFGATYVVLAPEHELVPLITTAQHKRNVEEYIEKTRKETDINRASTERPKTGVETGAFAINPINGEKIPIWIADYVLASYGTGAVMAVPAHDERDYAFARKYSLPIIPVIAPVPAERVDHRDRAKVEESLRKGVEKMLETGAFTDDGILIGSGSLTASGVDFSGLTSEAARTQITEYLKGKGYADFNVNYKLRDWLVSRQRYWGAPIPIVYCEKCGEVTVPEDQLPVELPRDVDFTPKGDGKSPLNTVPSFVNTKCPECGGPATREVDTMDTFVDSSWYFLRYPSARLADAPFDKELTKEWLPVDMYIGGPEHACMHLLYARFINMVLHDLGFIDFDEPFKKLVHQGMITKDGAKMSKSKGNVVSPDTFVEKYGSDVFRMYLMFMGPFSDGGDWNDQGITGIARFVERFYLLVSGAAHNDAAEKKDKQIIGDPVELTRVLHRTIKKVTEDIEKFQFNTALAAFMEFVNFGFKSGIDHDTAEKLVKLIAPLAPHLAEECYELLSGKYSVFDQDYPAYDESLIAEEFLIIPVQVMGKLRGQIKVPADATKEQVLAAAKIEENVARHLEDKKIAKEIYVPGKMVNFVVGGFKGGVLLYALFSRLLWS